MRLEVGAEPLNSIKKAFISNLFKPKGRLKNRSTYGALGYLIRKEADVYFRKEAPFYLDDSLILSSAVGNDEYASYRRN